MTAYHISEVICSSFFDEVHSLFVFVTQNISYDCLEDKTVASINCQAT